MNNQNHFQSIDPLDFVTKPFHLFKNQWLLLASGSFLENHFNAMTVSWGTMGIMWGKPIIMIMVRPQRHTLLFLEKYKQFTLSSFSENNHSGLELCGTLSGKTHPDKITQAGFTPIQLPSCDSPGFLESNLTFCCQILYQDRLKKENIPVEIDQNFYPAQDYHILYFAEILSVFQK